MKYFFLVAFQRTIGGLKGGTYIIPNGDELHPGQVFGPLQVDDRSELLRLERGEASGESGAPAASNRNPFEVIAGKRVAPIWVLQEEGVRRAMAVTKSLDGGRR